MTCYDTSRAPDRRRAPHTGRGSDSIVLIEAGASIRSFTVYQKVLNQSRWKFNTVLGT